MSIYKKCTEFKFFDGPKLVGSVFIHFSRPVSFPGRIKCYVMKVLVIGTGVKTAEKGLQLNA